MPPAKPVRIQVIAPLKCAVARLVSLSAITFMGLCVKGNGFIKGANIFSAAMTSKEIQRAVCKISLAFRVMVTGLISGLGKKGQ